MRVALLEDDLDQAALFIEWLKSAGHSCEHFESGKPFIRNIKHDSYDALILDWMVPDMDGFEVLRWVRENIDWPIPIVFVTAKDQEDDIVRALEEGADDYVIKPAKQRELLARISAVVRRAAPVDEAQTTIEQDPFVIDLGNHQMWVTLIVTLLFGLIGGVDDYRKLLYGNSKGLSAKTKYFWQTVFGLGAAVLLY